MKENRGSPWRMVVIPQSRTEDEEEQSIELEIGTEAEFVESTRYCDSSLVDISSDGADHTTVKIQNIRPEVDTEAGVLAESRDCFSSLQDDVVFRHAYLEDEKPMTLDTNGPLSTPFNCGIDLKQVLAESSPKVFQSGSVIDWTKAVTERDEALCGAGCAVLENERAQVANKFTNWHPSRDLRKVLDESGKKLLCGSVVADWQQTLVEETNGDESDTVLEKEHASIMDPKLQLLKRTSQDLQNRLRDASRMLLRRIKYIMTGLCEDEIDPENEAGNNFEAQTLFAHNSSHESSMDSSMVSSVISGSSGDSSAGSGSAGSGSASSASFDCITKDAFLSRSNRSGFSQLQTVKESNWPLSTRQASDVSRWMTSLHKLNETASASAMKLASDCLDDSSLQAEEGTEMPRIPARRVSKCSVLRKVRTAVMNRRSPSSVQDFPLRTEKQSRSSRQLLKELGKQDSSGFSDSSTDASTDSSSLEDHGAALFYDMEMLREKSEEPLYRYRDPTDNDSVKGHLVVFDVTETMKEIVAVIEDLKREGIASVVIDLLEELVSSLRIMEYQGPGRLIVNELEKSVSKLRDAMRPFAAKPAIEHVNESRGMPEESACEETPELQELKHSMAELQEDAPEVVLERLKASLAALREAKRAEAARLAVQ